MGIQAKSVVETVQADSGRSWVDSFRDIQSYLGDLPCSSALRYSVAGNPLLLHFGSECIRNQISHALDHLLCAQHAGPALTVFLHDLATAPRAAVLMRSLNSSGKEDEIWMLDTPDLMLIAQRQGRSFCAWDRRINTAYCLITDAASIPYIERALPLKPLLCHWLGERGNFLAHAAAVGIKAHGGVLVLGHGGAGKSTTALMCLEAGMGYASDDHCLVSIDGQPTAHSLYATAKVAIAELHRFPSLAATVDTHGRPPKEKALMVFNPLLTPRIERSMPLRALLLARITNSIQTTLRPLSAAHAYRAIAPSCALHPPSRRSAALHCFNGLARQLPAYVLELGSNRASTPKAIQQLLEASSSAKGCR